MIAVHCRLFISNVRAKKKRKNLRSIGIKAISSKKKANTINNYCVESYFSFIHIPISKK